MLKIFIFSRPPALDELRRPDGIQVYDETEKAKSSITAGPLRQLRKRTIRLSD